LKRMNKTKSKVLSLILASAMVVSSFSSLNFASAASRTENGIVDVKDDEIYLLSDPDKVSDYYSIEDFIGEGDVQTYDKDDASGAEVVKITHVSGDKLLKFKTEKDDVQIAVKSDVVGKEVINVRWEADYDRDDKEVTVRADKDITVYVDTAGELFLGKADDLNEAADERPGDVPTAAVNEQYLEIGLYKAVAPEELKNNYTDLLAKYEKVDVNTAGYFKDNKAVDDKISLEKDKIFAKKDITSTTDGVIRLKTTFEPAVKADSATSTKRSDADLADTGKATLEIVLGQEGDKTEKKQDVTVSVVKKWNADVDLTTGAVGDINAWEINKRSGKTYIVPRTLNLDWDDKDDWNAVKDSFDVNAVNTYDTIVTKGTLKVLGGSVGDLEATGDSSSISVEGGSTGYLKAPDVSVEGGSVGLIKDKATKVEVSGGKVSAIDAKDGTSVVTITGGEISGDVFGNTVSIDADDDDVKTVISGKVTADSDSDDAITIDASSDASVTVKGIVKNEGEGSILISGENVELGTVDADYSNDINFEDFTGTIKALSNVDDDVNLTDESVVVLTSGTLTADTVDVEEDSKIQVAQADLDSISGEGTFAFPAGKLFVEDGIDSDTILVITEGLEVGATAFTSYEDAVDGSDLNTLGFTLETKSASSTTEKHIIKSVQFAGVKFDKTDLRIAKGYSDTVTVANYPSGTALPAGYTIEWDVDVNDDYISVTTEGNVATIKALDYSTDRAVDNQGKITATVVDEDGYEVEDLLVATVNVTAIAVPDSTVTLDTTKPVTVGTGAVYQYIAKSSTAAVLSAASSDTQIATVELFNAADPRGYKFQVKGIAPGTATITTTDANGASATLTVNVVKVNGTLKADTTTYTFAPGKVYDVKFSTTGTTAVPVVTVNGKVVSIAPRGNGVYRVTAQNPGTAYVVATVGNTHVSVKFVVANGAASVGVKGNNVSTLK
ncbi:MAG: Ig domain-containing protein, partial [Faecalispora jeddahensis]|uniref:Ig-like domain-containing protein n=1 Tax=Faecalispora jeddahensis TaxID=1414721 RepID=UPI003993CE79